MLQYHYRRWLWSVWLISRSWDSGEVEWGGIARVACCCCCCCCCCCYWGTARLAEIAEGLSGRINILLLGDWVWWSINLCSSVRSLVYHPCESLLHGDANVNNVGSKTVSDVAGPERAKLSHKNARVTRFWEKYWTKKGIGAIITDRQ